MIPTGPALDARVARLSLWYAQERQRLITRMTQDHPYGSVKLDKVGQWTRYVEMKPADYEMVISQLNDKYRGLPNAYDLVNHDLRQFISHMIGLAIEGTQAASNGS